MGYIIGVNIVLHNYMLQVVLQCCIFVGAKTPINGVSSTTRCVTNDEPVEFSYVYVYIYIYIFKYIYRVLTRGTDLDIRYI